MTTVLVHLAETIVSDDVVGNYTADYRGRVENTGLLCAMV
jgi:hypothetical protein